MEFIFIKKNYTANLYPFNKYDTLIHFSNALYFFFDEIITD